MRIKTFDERRRRQLRRRKGKSRGRFSLIEQYCSLGNSKEIQRFKDRSDIDSIPMPPDDSLKGENNKIPMSFLKLLSLVLLKSQYVCNRYATQ